jgi:hypothetical protein
MKKPPVQNDRIPEDKTNPKDAARFFMWPIWSRIFTLTRKVFMNIMVCLGIIVILGGIAFASSASVRMGVMEVLVNMEEKYVEKMLLANKAAAAYVPAEWGGKCFPISIPTEFGLVSTFNEEGRSTACYRDTNEPKRTIDITEYGKDAETKLEVNLARIKALVIRGEPGMVVTKGASIHVCWYYEDKYFDLAAENVDETTLLMIAKSTIRVKWAAE